MQYVPVSLALVSPALDPAPIGVSPVLSGGDHPSLPAGSALPDAA